MITTTREILTYRLKEISDERRALNEERWKVIDELKKLDEAAGNQTDLLELVNGLHETIKSVKELVPVVKPEDIIQHVAERHGHLVDVEQAPQESHVQTEIKKEMINSTNVQTKQYYNQKETASIVYRFVREQGGLSSNKDIERHLKTFGISYKDISNGLWNLRAADSRLQKGGRGFTSVVVEEEPTQSIESGETV